VLYVVIIRPFLFSNFIYGRNYKWGRCLIGKSARDAIIIIFSCFSRGFDRSLDQGAYISHISFNLGDWGTGGGMEGGLVVCGCGSKFKPGYSPSSRSPTKYKTMLFQAGEAKAYIGHCPKCFWILPIWHWSAFIKKARLNFDKRGISVNAKKWRMDSGKWGEIRRKMTYSIYIILKCDQRTLFPKNASRER